jgi:3-dehydroquinate dehydratase-1
MTQTKAIQVHRKPLGGGARPIIITPLVGKTTASVLDEVAAIVPKRPDLLEWRIDFFADIGDAKTVVETAHAIRQAAGGRLAHSGRRHPPGRPLTRRR